MTNSERINEVKLCILAMLASEEGLSFLFIHGSSGSGKTRAVKKS